MRLVRAIIIVGFAVAPVAASADTLHLICTGAGETPKAETSRGFATNSMGDTASATIVRTRDREFADQINVEIAEGEGRIRLPRTMLPLIRGGEDGWFRLTNIEETPSEITAKAYVNVMSRPDIRIDRITGTISISGRIGHFAGDCEPFDPSTVQRRF